MTTTDIRDTLHEVGAATQVPQVDHVALRRRVRAERRRHVLGRTAALGAAAAVLVVSGTAAVQIAGTDGVDRPSPAPAPPRAVDVTPPDEVVYFLSSHRLKALDPTGRLHDLGPAEEVLGFTAEGVWAIDDESHLVWYAARRGAGGAADDGYSFERTPGPPGVDSPPVSRATQRASMSADGRYLAWMDLDGAVTSFDLKADQPVAEVSTPENTALVDVGSGGALLVSEDGDLVLRRPDGSSAPIPTQGDGYGLGSSLAGDVVAVGDRDGSTRMYRVSADGTERFATVPGSGDLAPDGQTYAALSRTADDTGSVLRLWRGDDAAEATGLSGTPETLQWVDLGGDEPVLLVVTGHRSGNVLYACAADSAACTAVHADEDIRLPGSGY